MDQFAGTTIVNPLMRIRRKRLLPKGGEVIVRVGQDVPPLHVLARTPLTSEFFVVSLDKILGIKPDELPERLMVQIGESLDQDTVLAEKKRLIGSKPILSPVDGTLAAVDNGRLVFQQATEWLELRAMVKGRVINYETNLGVTLEIVGALIQGVWATGDITIGSLHPVTDDPGKPLLAANIPDNINNLILVAGSINDPQLLHNLTDSTLRGIIAGSMPTHLCEIAKTNGLSVILTDGIGNQPMAAPIFQLLQTVTEEETSLFTKYNPLIGERPEIIIPRSEVPQIEPPPYNKPLTVGNIVRVLGQPHHSKTGSITKVFQTRHQTLDGINTHGAKVRFADGKEVFIPAANLDVFI